MAQLTGGEALIETLKAYNVDTVFGIISVHMLPVYDAMQRRGGMRLIIPRHEQAAVHMADGYARVSGRIGVCFTSTGPGAANSMGGMFEAYASSSPVLHITSQINHDLIGQHKGFLHEAKDQLTMLETAAGWTAQVQHVEQIPQLVGQAMEILHTRRPRPAAIEIPIDLQTETADIYIVPPETPFTRRPADASDIAEAVRLLKAAERPVIWAGGGVISAEAHDELRMLAEILSAAVLTTVSGRGALPEDHPLCIGNFALEPTVQEFLSGCDLMLAIGTRFAGQATSNWTLPLPQPLIHIDIDPQEIGKSYPVTVGLVGDAKATLRQLIDGLGAWTAYNEEKADARATLSQPIDGPSGNRSDARDGYRQEVVRVARETRRVARERQPQTVAIIDAIRSALPRDAIVVCDSTVLGYFGINRLLPIYEPRTFINSHGSVAIGPALPLALGAKAAMPERTVLAVAGDGGFMLHCAELASAVQHGLNVVTLVMNDGGYGVLRRAQRARFEGRHIGVDLHTPDFPRFAETFGALGLRVDRVEDLEATLQQAINAGQPALIEARLELDPPF